jgi:uncharacterized membrane protein
MQKDGLSSLALALLAIIAILAFLGALAQITNSGFGELFLPPSSDHVGGVFYEVIATLLTIAVDILYLFGGGVVFFGAMLTLIRFGQVKIKDPYKPAGVARQLSGYLTLSLELFIGAEIVKTATTQALADLEILILIIISRGLFSLILYLERKWRGSDTETE